MVTSAITHKQMVTWYLGTILTQRTRRKRRTL